MPGDRAEPRTDLGASGGESRSGSWSMYWESLRLSGPQFPQMLAYPGEDEGCI